MEIAVSSWCWHARLHAGDFHLPDAPPAAKRLGFDAVELNDFMLPPPRFSRVRRPALARLGAPEHLWRYSEANLREVKVALNESAARCVAWTVDSDFTAPPHRWITQQWYLRRGVRAAKMLDAKVLRVTLGGRPDAEEGVDETAAARLVETVREADGLTVAVENHWGLSTDIDRFLKIVSLAKSRLPPEWVGRLGVCFDPGNVPDEGREKHWRALANQAAHFHFKVGDRAMPYEQLGETLEGYRGAATLEYEGSGEAETGILQGIEQFRRLIP